MNPIKTAFRAALGRRLPVTEGVLAVDGLEQPVTIGRDRFGIPHINAKSDADAWFALGFCQGQDRAFQTDMLARVARGRVSEMAGKDALAIDRLSRRIGFRRTAEETMHLCDDVERLGLESFAAGINAGRARGLAKKAHEYALLRSDPLPFEAIDCLAIFALMAFSLASNWDAELARLAILTQDGPTALADLDPSYPEWHPVTNPPGVPAGPAATGLREDMEHFRATVGLGGGSNNWAVAGSKTATGRPIMANDPHLAPVLPPHWYLAHLMTPEWSIAGATLAATPAFAAGHNGHVAWGVTAGLLDNTDLFVEELGPDGRTAREGDEFVPCEVHHELIEVKGGDPVVEDVVVTNRGPIVGPGLAHAEPSLSMAATWLAPQGVTALLTAPRLKTVTEFREALAAWHGPGLNMVLADDAGTIGWQMIGEIPLRKSGNGALPLAGWDLAAGWHDDYVDSTRLPSVENPDAAYIATANNRPIQDDDDPFLSVDWIEGYRITRINELLAPRDDWDVAATLHAQLDTITPAWSDLREHVLGIGQRSSSAAAYALLRDWDGNMHRHSAAASVFVLWNTEMQRRVALARAPLSAAAALGRGFAPDLVANSLFAFGRTSHLVRLLRERPDGWFEDWDEEMAAALAVGDALLRVRFGDDPDGWEWGTVRPLTLRHPIGERKPMDQVFNIGPIPWSGDFTTVSQSGAPPLEPLGNPSAIASLRMAVDVGDWDRSRFSLPGGQSGNPLSPHYRDQIDLWAWGVGCPMPWSENAVTAAVVETLHLVHTVEDDD